MVRGIRPILRDADIGGRVGAPPWKRPSALMWQAGPKTADPPHFRPDPGATCRRTPARARPRQAYRGEVGSPLGSWERSCFSSSPLASSSPSSPDSRFPRILRTSWPSRARSSRCIPSRGTPRSERDRVRSLVSPALNVLSATSLASRSITLGRVSGSTAVEAVR